MAGLIFIEGLKLGETDDIRNHMLAWETETGLPFFDFDKLSDTLGELIANGHTGFDDLYGNVDIRAHLSVDRYPGQAVSTCLLRRYAYGWFHMENGSSRYYSRMVAQDMPENPTTLAFDLVDLLKIYWNVLTKEALYDRLKTAFPYVESSIVSSERSRYEENRDFLSEYIQSDQRLLSEADVHILNALIDAGDDSLMDRMPVVEGKACFFSSRKYLLKQLKEHGVTLSQTKLSYHLTRLAAIGLIRKVGYREETATQYKKSMDIYQQKSHNKESFYNVITYFQVETFSRVIRHAEKRGRYIERKNVRLDQINETEVIRLFGSTWAKRVYPETTNKRETRYAEEIKAYKQAFYWLLNKQGYVTKEQLSSLANKKLADRLWTRYVNRTLGMSKRFSQYLKDFLNLEGTGAVFLSHALLHDYHTMLQDITDKGVERYVQIIQKELVRLSAFWRDSVVRRVHIHRLDDGTVAIC